MLGDSLRIGIRVTDVETSRRVYGGLGFEEVGVIPGPRSEPSC
jgi:catechol 2,3-dioxygenase-like lactoylglutathione lyase family enzyme